MEHILGIDLGAWGASVAAVVNGELRVASTENGPQRLASFFSVDDKGVAYLTDAARRRLVTHPEASVVASASMLGRQANDALVARSNAYVPVTMHDGPAGFAVVTLAGKDYAPVEIAAQMFAYLHALAEKNIGAQGKRVVLAVPAWLNDPQRHAFVLAANMAGLDVVRVLGCTTAAVLSALDEQPLAGRCLVVDLGASQTSAAVVDVHEQVLETLGLAFDPLRGSREIDIKLMQQLQGELEDVNACRLDDIPGARTRLLLAAENAKRSLTDHETVGVRLREIAAPVLGGVDLNTSIERSTLTYVAQDYVEAVLAVADDAIRYAGVDIGSLSTALLIGGGSRLCGLVHDLEALCGCKAIVLDDTENMAVKGCARYGHQLAGATALASSVAVLAIEANPADLCVATAGGYHEVVVSRGARLPVSAQRIFTTSQDQQKQIRVLISQNDACGETARIGEFVLDNLEPKPRGAVRIEVGFNLDVDGTVHVTARDFHSGQKSASDLRLSLAVADQAVSAIRDSRRVLDKKAQTGGVDSDQERRGRQP